MENASPKKIQAPHRGLRVWHRGHLLFHGLAAFAHGLLRNQPTTDRAKATYYSADSALTVKDVGKRWEYDGNMVGKCEWKHVGSYGLWKISWSFTYSYGKWTMS